MRLIAMGRATALALMLAGLSGTAGAQQPNSAQANAIRQNCRADYQSLCAAVPPGGQASLQCLAQHAAQLSPPCGQAVSAATGGSAPAPAGAPPPHAVPPYGALSPPPPMSPRQEMMLMRQACGADYRRLCTGVQPGGGRALACLANHSMSLSPSCEQALMEMHARR